jgi:hypothetical protein
MVALNGVCIRGSVWLVRRGPGRNPGDPDHADPRLTLDAARGSLNLRVGRGCE